MTQKKINSPVFFTRTYRVKASFLQHGSEIFFSDSILRLCPGAGLPFTYQRSKGARLSKESYLFVVPSDSHGSCIAMNNARFLLPSVVIVA